MLFLAAMALSSTAFGSPILYTLTATGSGNVGVTTFTNAAITFTQVADFNNVQHTTVVGGADAYYTVGDYVLMSINGVGNYTLTSAMFLTEAGVLHAGSGAFGIYDNYSGGFYGIDSPDYLTYFLGAPSLLTGGQTAVLDYQRSLISTAGDVHFATFTGGNGSAIGVTPEPSSLVLLGTGALGVMAFVRRFRTTSM